MKILARGSGITNAIDCERILSIFGDYNISNIKIVLV
jgi:hypothetical protein